MTSEAPEGRPGVVWENYVGERGFTPALTFDATTDADVAAIVAEAAEDGERVHVAGRGHSSSPLVRTDGYLIRTSQLTGVLALDGKRHVRVKAGTRISDMNDALDGLGLAMKNLGSAALQSIYGAIATGTHGSGVGFGALADLVRSVDLVDGAGKRWRIEPSAGFSDSVPAGVELLTSDEAFHSVVVGVGVTGLVTSLVLEVREAYDLVETRTLDTWQRLRDSPDTDDVIRAAAHYELWLNPYDDQGRNTALVTIREEAEPGTARKPRTDPLILRTHIGRALIAWLLDTFPWAVRPALDYALGTQAKTSVDAAHRIFDIGVINHMEVVATEWFFPMSRWRSAVDALLREASLLAARPHVVGGVPFGVRFVKGGPHFLAMTYGEGDLFCAVELPTYTTLHDRRSLLVHYERIAEREGGRPHWGQLHRGRPGTLQSRYPQVDRWRAVRDQLDPEERFANRSTYEEGLTRSRVPHALFTRSVDLYDPSVPRDVLELGYMGSQPILVDRRRFEVEASASEFARAFQEVLLEPGFLIARRFEVLRLRERVGKPFELGERFQGRFALDEELLEDTLPHPAWWTWILRAFGVGRALKALEDQGLSNYGEVSELELSPAPGQPYSIRYRYLTGTPFAGESHFTVQPLGAGRCFYTERITFQPTTDLNRIAMEAIGLNLHNHVVLGQVEAAADRLGVRFKALDLADLGKPTG